MADFPDEIFRSLVDAATDFIGTVDRDGCLLYLNPAGRRMLEIPLDEDIVGQSILPYNESTPDEIFAEARIAPEVGTVNRISVFVSRSGKRAIVSQIFIVHETSVGTQYSTIARDISDRIAAEQVLRHRADHDPLTGMWNRAAFMRLADERVRTAATSITMLDLDGFKAVNDRHGHHEGDSLLINVANVLVEALPTNSIIARLGGDEFVVITDGHPSTTISAALRPILNPYGADVSIGTTPFCPGVSREDALRLADEALYRNKRKRSAVITQQR